MRPLKKAAALFKVVRRRWSGAADPAGSHHLVDAVVDGLSRDDD